MGTLHVRRIDDATHLAYINSHASVSFLQTPAWGRIKTGWQPQSLGWFDGDNMIGAGLLLLRQVPRVRRYLAYLPEGPDLPWREHAAEGLAALVEYAREQRAFQLTIGPH